MPAKPPISYSQFKKVTRFIKNPFRWIKNKLLAPFRAMKRKASNATKKQIFSIVVGYIVCAFPATYLMTAVTTPASIANPAEVVKTAEAAGVGNLLTWGLGTPAVEGVKSAAGSILKSAGDAFDSSGLTDLGQSWITSAENWFETGYGTVGDLVIDFDIPEAPSEPAFDLSEMFSAKSFLGMFGLDWLIDDSQPATPTQTDGVTPSEGERWTVWNESEYPDYYREIGPAVMDRSVKAGEIQYDGLDKLGRTQRVVGQITYEMYAASKGWREEFEKDSDPSGWGHNEKVSIELPTGKTYNGYMFNRSHLIADSLGGKAAKENLVTGTRMQNVGANNSKGGMAYTETLARNYLEEHPDCVIYYSAEPIYHGDELVPRSVIVNVHSCDGGLDKQVEVFNTAKGYTIDYMTGEFSKNE